MLFSRVCIHLFLERVVSLGKKQKQTNNPKQDFMNLTGSIPSELAAVKSLERLSMTGNFLSENIPSEMGNMPRLSWLNVGDNYLTGTYASCIYVDWFR
jgi:Leucine-rich repeat (LRR) protein